jgi:hypothetical protein
MALAISFVGGAAFRSWWIRRQEAAALQVPEPWPLEARKIVNSSEAEVWDWLSHTFYDHLVLVKVPVLRFTMPRRGERYRSAKWLQMLGEVYPTFTVCTKKGVVVGCVDVPGKAGLNRASHVLKEGLLADCNIAYTVLRSTRLPQPDAMRAAFLGVLADNVATQPLPSLNANSEFTAEIKAFNRIKHLREQRAVRETAQEQIKKHTQDAANSNFGGLNGRHADSQVPSQWENSFISEKDSRMGTLR